MSTATYHGSCHCKKVRFEAELDLEAGTGKCNCSFCWKARNWSIGIKPDAFRLLEGKDNIGEYGFRPEAQNHHAFCKNCGIRVYTHGYVEACSPRKGGRPSEAQNGEARLTSGASTCQIVELVFALSKYLFT